MRVVAGKYKGRKLCSFEGKEVRPTSDRAKEGVFSVLQFDIPGKSFYDGFCGSGAMGIEAISRGASKVVFTDSSSKSCQLTKKNLTLIGESATVINSDCLDYLNNTKEKFDIIFLDPPYKSNSGISALKIIAKRDLLNAGGKVVIESGSAVNCAIEGLILEKQKKYGICEFSFYKKANKKTCVFAGSFDPVTNGHVHVVKKALEQFDSVIVALGVNENKTYAFDKYLKLEMLEETFKSFTSVKVCFFDGYLVDFLKENSVIYNVRGIRNQQDLNYEEQMYALNKKAYPEITNVYIKADEDMCEISSSRLKEKILLGEDVSHFLPKEICQKVVNFLKGNN